MHIQHGQDAQTVEGVEFAEMNQAFLALFFSYLDPSRDKLSSDPSKQNEATE